MIKIHKLTLKVLWKLSEDTYYWYHDTLSIINAPKRVKELYKQEREKIQLATSEDEKAAIRKEYSEKQTIEMFSTDSVRYRMIIRQAKRYGVIIDEKKFERVYDDGDVGIPYLTEEGMSFLKRRIVEERRKDREYLIKWLSFLFSALALLISILVYRKK